MAERKAIWIHGDAGSPDYSAEDARLLATAALGGGMTDDAASPATGAIARGHGVISGMVVAPNSTPNSTVEVSAGVACVRGTQTNAQGHYIVRNDATAVLNVTAADGTNSRRDLVVAQVRDDQYAAFDQDDWVLDIIEGPADGSNADPTVPADCLVLARLAIAAGPGGETISSGSITPLAPQVRATGGITPVASLAAWPNPQAGDVVYRLDVDRLAIYDGTTWRHKETQYIASGAASVVFSAEAVIDEPVSFGITFASNPRVFATPGGTNTDASVVVNNVSTTGFIARTRAHDGASITGTIGVRWLAIGDLAT